MTNIADDDRTRAARALAMPDTHTFVEGTGWVAPMAEVTGRGRTVRLGDTVTGTDVTMGPVVTGVVIRIQYVHPGTGEIRARVRLADGERERVVSVDTVHTSVAPRAAAIIGRTPTRASVVIAHDVDPDGFTARTLAQDYANETGEPVTVHAVPYGAGSTGPVDLPFVGTFAPTVTGPCWDGRAYDVDDTHGGILADSTACTRRATTTVPAVVWDAGSQHAYPTNVPVCRAHAREAWAGEAAADARAEGAYLMGR